MQTAKSQIAETACRPGGPYVSVHTRIRGPQDYLDDLEDPPEDEDYDVLSDA